MIFEGKDYREILRSELQKRMKTNPRYSMRAYARDLGISISRLSEILRSKQGLSHEFAEKISLKLGFSAEEREYFCDLVDSLHGRSEIKKATAKTKLTKYQDFESRKIQLDTYRVISDWYHFAILELCEVKGFQNDTEWIARQLNIKKAEALGAIRRLKRLGFLIESEGRLLPAENFTSTTDGVPSAVIQKSHQQLLNKALEAIDQQTVEERSTSAIILAIDRQHLPRAFNLIKEFRRQFCKEIGEGGAKDTVYCLSVQFFNLLAPMQKGPDPTP